MYILVTCLLLQRNVTILNINNAAKKLYFLFEKIDHNYYFRFKHCT